MSFPISSHWLRWLLIGAAVPVAVFALLVIDPSGALLFRVAGLMLFALSVVTMLLTLRKARKLSPWPLVIGAVVSVACTWIFFAPAGATAGAGWSLTNLPFVDGETIKARGNMWLLAVWALSLMMTQTATLTGGRTPYVLALVSFPGMGLAAGNSLGLLARYANARQLLLCAAILVIGERR